MSKLVLTTAKAKSLYNSLDAAGKAKMEVAFGKKALGIMPEKKVITGIIPLNQITSYKDVCRIKKIHPVKSLPYSKPRTEQQEYLNQVFIVDNIIEVLNRGKETLSFSKTKQPKWRAWFEWSESKACFVFGRSNAYCAGADAGCGPRLCLNDQPTSDYFGRTFLPEVDKLLRFTHGK